jgi:hypothetical protein
MTTRATISIAVVALATTLLGGLTAPTAATTERSVERWAFFEDFDGDPAAPSQDLLPRTFDYSVTHRTHPQWQFTKRYEPFPADHGDDCAGPSPDVTPLPQHDVRTRQDSNGTNPDDSFFICKNHMMSALGDIEAYSLSSFWPRQEFDFSDGGTLQFDVNINLGHSQRHWWEVMIVPRDQLKVAPAHIESAVDERYPNDRIVLNFQELIRRIGVGTGDVDPQGWLVDQRERGRWDFSRWNDRHPDDPALDDRRIRRTMRITFDDDRITWGIETETEGVFDDFSVDVPGGLPFTRGLVLFKTHSYTPGKQNNTDTFTFHWDNIGFTGPVVGRYDSYEADDVVYLEANGDRPVGDSQTVTIFLPRLGRAPVLFGEVHNPIRGQVLVSVNGRPNRVVNPYEYNRNDCVSTDWKSFRLPIRRKWLRRGLNTVTFTVGEADPCPRQGIDWDGYSVKSLEIQLPRKARGG